MQHAPRSLPPGTARHARIAGHFGELLQGRLGTDGPVVLITLPCRALSVQAVWCPGPGFGLWQGGRPVLSRRHLAWLFAALGAGAPRGRLRLRVGMPPGGGAGASTAARLAVLRCLAPAPLTADAEAALCLALEGASDPLMLPRPERALWAPRTAQLVGMLPPLPAFEVMGGFAGPGRRTEPKDTRFADVADLVAAWRRAPGRAALAQIATESARRTHALRGGPDPTPLIAAGRMLGALGVAVAHTGTAQALLFAPGTVPGTAAAVLRDLGLAQITAFRAGGRA